MNDQITLRAALAVAAILAALVRAESREPAPESTR